MEIVAGIIALIVGVVVILRRRRLADRAHRIATRRFGALGQENAKRVTSGAYVLGGVILIAVGVWGIISYYVAYGF